MNEILLNLELDARGYIVPEDEELQEIKHLEEYYRLHPHMHLKYMCVTGTVKIRFLNELDFNSRFVFVSQGTVIFEYLNGEWQKQDELLPLMRYVSRMRPVSSSIIVCLARRINSYDQWCIVLK